MTKQELRRRALRAAAAVAFTFGLAGCGGSVEFLDEDQDGAVDPGDEAPSDDVAVTPPARGPTPTEEEPVAAIDPKLGIADAGAGEMCIQGSTEEEMKAYLDCCNENGWNWDLGC